MAGITAVKPTKDVPSKTGPIVVGLLGLLFLFTAWQVGLVFIVAAVLWFKALKATWKVVLSTSGGDQPGFESTDEQQVRRIVGALNDAIVARG